MEDLEQQVTEYPEPSAEVQPEPTPEPEPEVAAEPELESPPVSPDWLDGAGAIPEPEPAPQPQYPPQQPYPQAPPPQYAQVPQQAPQTMSDQQIESFVRDPDTYVNRLVQAQVEQAMGPTAMQANQAAYGVQSFISSQAEASIGNAKRAIGDAYRDVFNQDEAFRGNKELQNRVGASLQGLLEQAAYGARGGNFNDIALFQSFGPAQARATLAAAKALMGIQGQAVAPMNVAGAVVERTAGAVQKDAIQLTADEETTIAARSRVEPGYRDRYIKAKQEAIDRGDVENI